MPQRRVTETQPRILDAAYRMPGGMVILSMTDDLQVNSKGMDLDARFFIALRGNDEW